MPSQPKYSGSMKCYFCGEKVNPKKFHVHHKDGDHSNDAKSNKAAAHPRCHLSYHAQQPRGPRPQEVCEKISNALRGKKKTVEHKAKIAASVKQYRTENG